jgi:hypothetical protein
VAALAELLGADAVERLAALKANLSQRPQQPPVAGGQPHQYPVGSPPTGGHAAPVCGACGQPMPNGEEARLRPPSAPAAVFRAADHRSG